jgi:hypothetical protein
MAWYFGMCLLLNAAFGVWGSVNADIAATAALTPATLMATCTLINTFLLTFAMM